tara:strand:- start:1721 stop:2842 length:1122 start_codon:yes stop_codon:yes gene_type:complete
MPIKVLLVGINYLMNKDDILKSPINNIEILNDFLISYIGVDKKNIVMLSDSPNYKNATFFNISTTLKNMTETSGKNDFLFLYFSGYGNFLGIPEKNSDKYLKESMKMKTLYKKKHKDILFLPEDYNMSTLTKDYYYKILKNSRSRTFLFFDCYNKENLLNLDYYYNINNKTYINSLDDNPKINDKIIVLSCNTVEKKNFEFFSKVNIINNKVHKYFSIFLLEFVKILFNYLQININFNTFSYKNMYKVLLEINTGLNKLNFSSLKKAENEKMNKGCCGCDIKYNIMLLFSNEKLIHTNFFDNEANEITNDQKENELIEKKLILRDKTLAFKNIKLEREVKILKKRFNNLITNYEKQKKKIQNSNSNINFNLLL